MSNFWLLTLVASLLSGPVALGQKSIKGEGKTHGQPPQPPSADTDQIASYVGQVGVAETVQQLAPFPGRAVKQLVAPGDPVRKGQKILVLEQKTLGETYLNHTAVANIAGILNEYHVANGFEFTTNTPLFTILD